MAQHPRATLIAALLLAVSFLAACGSGEEDDHDFVSPSFVLTFRADADTGLGVSARGANRLAGQPMDYPGVTAFRANHLLKLRDLSISPDGSHLVFKIVSISAMDIPLLWLRVTPGSGIQLVSRPRVVNGKGENIFILGPLPAGGSVMMALELALIKPQGAKLFLDFMQIYERVAFASNREDPTHSQYFELYSSNLDGSDIFRITRNSPYLNINPSWSPGGEWLLFERQVNVMCGNTAMVRVRVHEIHPDGSNLTQISKNVFFSSNPTYNPTGDLIAYDCRMDCHAAFPNINICLYDRTADTEKVLFHGAPYDLNTIAQPYWSPDGKYLVMNALEPGTHAQQWLYAEVDPLTGDTMMNPAVFLRGNFPQIFPDGNEYRVFVQDWTWAPDSRHAIIDCIYYKKSGTNWVNHFQGLALLDFAALRESPSLPVVPPLDKVLPSTDADGYAHFTAFDRTAIQLWFENLPASGIFEIQYLDLLDDYRPATGERLSFFSDSNSNRMPALFREPLPVFFPLGP